MVIAEAPVRIGIARLTACRRSAMIAGEVGWLA
jgi:hypothetical protein